MNGHPKDNHAHGPMHGHMHDHLHKGHVLITGASGGFGRAFARAFAARGHALILHGRDEKRLESLRAVLPQPECHRILTANLATESGIRALLRELEDTEAETFRLAGLVNNAGFGLWGGFAELPRKPQLDVLRVDLLAPVALTHALLPRLVAARGFIVNVSSLAGESPMPWMSGYAAAKAGLTFWSEALREEMRGRLRIVTLAPGPSPTGFREVSGMPEDGRGAIFRESVETIIARALATLDAGGGYCVPGWRHRLLWLLQKTVPRPLALKLIARSLRPGR